MKRRHSYFTALGYAPLKRVLDVCGSILLLLVLSPLIGGIAAMILLADGMPIFFSQRRPGHLEVPFSLYKFRTMRPSVSSEGSDETSRITKLGRKLRKTSLDELPSLVNVLRGDMSFVGPRPLLMSYLPIYSPRHRRRHDVRPGITGLAQVSGRNRLTWFDRFEIDVTYVSSRSIHLDVIILLKSILVVIQGDGVMTDEGEIMKELVQDYDLVPHGPDSVNGAGGKL